MRPIADCNPLDKEMDYVDVVIVIYITSTVNVIL